MDTSQVTYEALVKENKRLRIQVDQLSHNSDADSIINVYNYLFENSLDGYAYCKMIFEEDRPVDFMYLDTNPAFERLTGIKNAKGKLISELLPELIVSNPDIFRIYGIVAQTEEPAKIEAYINSLKIWLSISVISPQKGYFIALFDDCTARIEANKKLAQTHNFLNNVIDNSPIAMAVLDKDGELLRMNHECRRVFNLPDDESLVPYNVLKDTQLAAQGFMPAIESVFKYGGKTQYINRYQVPDGESLKNGGTVILDVSISAVMEDGKVVCGIVQYIDITVSTLQSKALHESQEKLKSVIDSVSIGIAITNNQGDFIDCNEAAGSILGCSREEFLKRNVFRDTWNALRTDYTVLPKEEYPSYIALIENKSVVNKMVGVIKQNGGFIWCSLSAIPIKVNDLGIVVTIADITKNIETKNAYQRRFAQLQLITDNLPVLISYVNKNEEYLFVNNTYHKIFGIRPEDIIGKTILNLVGEEHYSNIKP